MCESPENCKNYSCKKRSIAWEMGYFKINDDSVIKLRIEGVGGRAVKLGKFMNYDKIFEEDDLVAKQLLEKVQKL